MRSTLPSHGLDSFAVVQICYLVQNIQTRLIDGSHFNILSFLFKLALVASFLRAKFKIIFYLERGNEGYLEYKLNNIKMAAILE